MKTYKTFGEVTFHTINMILMAFLTVICVLPFLHTLAISLSSNVYAQAGEVGFLPVGFSLRAYQFVAAKGDFIQAFGVSVERLVIGLLVGMLLIVLTAYPLSKEKKIFRARTVFAWIFAFTMYFNPGLMPQYMVVKMTGLIDSIWALILPQAVAVFYIVLILNFFRSVPKEIEESAIMDGAGQFRILFRMYIPVSKPALATVALMIMVGHWNSWFEGLIFMNNASKYPLQTYLQTLVIQKNSMFITKEDIERFKDLSEITVRSSQIFLGALPMIIIYPYLQRFFIKGIVLGSVKG